MAEQQAKGENHKNKSSKRKEHESKWALQRTLSTAGGYSSDREAIPYEEKSPSIPRLDLAKQVRNVIEAHHSILKVSEVNGPGTFTGAWS